MNDEKRKLIEVYIDVIADLTLSNEHDAAALFGAHLLGDKQASEVFFHVGRIAELEGSIPEELYQYRTRKVRDMLDGAALVLGDELAKKLKAAY